ncbi:MAG: Zn-dependent hydrolase, partial [Deltaproteobacteria bacterium]|nr:Zn-dependent hydrolase [Deltaproteobacteria bacterium]
MKTRILSRHVLLISLTLTWLSFSMAHSACRNPNVAGDSPFVTYAAASGPVEIKWFGHSFFQITSSLGTKIITDPFGSMGFPMPEVWADIVTVGREHGNHNNVSLVKGKPVVLKGLKEGGNEWDD